MGFLAPILLTLIWFLAQGALPDYIRAAFLQNVGYLSTFRPGDVAKPFLTRNAPLLIRAAVVALGTAVVWLKRKKLSKEFIFATIWILFALFAVTLSERPYPHYLLQAVPALSLLVAILVKGETIDQVLTIIPIGILLFVPFFFKFYNYSTTGYYTRFIGFATGQMTKNAYMNSFDKNTAGNYKLADFLVKSSGPEERIFVWGDSPVIYALTRRLPATKFVAAYHIADFSTKAETVKTLNQSKPSYVVILDGSPAFNEIKPFLASSYVLISSEPKEEIWRLWQK